MDMIEEFRGMQKSAAAMDEHNQQLEKLAFFGLGTAAWWGSTWAVSEALRRFGAKRAPDFLRAGLQHGQEGTQLGHNTRNFTQNIFGRRSYGPYERGREIGADIQRQGMAPGEARYYIRQLAADAAEQKRQVIRKLEVEGKLDTMKPDWAGDALQQVAQGAGNTKFSRFLSKRKTSPETKPNLLHDAVQATYSLPMGIVDKRYIARPVLRKLDGTKIGDKIESMAQTNKLTQGLRNFVD